MTEKFIEKLESMRQISGFPKADETDIISISDFPNYTACPNPFLEEIIKNNNTQQNKDNYQKTPFVTDVSEGKNDPRYNMHSYHTKVPPKAIARYILHYTNPGDLIYDGFCGSGMTGVAAQICNNPDQIFKNKIESEMKDIEWGERTTILCDLSPIATLIAHNMNNAINSKKFVDEANRVLDETNNTLEWMYKTKHNTVNNKNKNSENQNIGEINYIIYSDVFVCPECLKELIFWEVAGKNKGVEKEFSCIFCDKKLVKTDLERVWETTLDKFSKKPIQHAKQVPVLINYNVIEKGIQKSYEKIPDEYDFELIEKIKQVKIEEWYPKNELPKGENTNQPIVSHKYTHVNHFYTKRNLAFLALLKNNIGQIPDKEIRNRVYLLQNSFNPGFVSKLTRYNFKKRGNSALAGTLYVPSFSIERNVNHVYKNKLKDFVKGGTTQNKNSTTYITTQSSTQIPQIPDNSIDYIFTDPPFGKNLMYSELNFIWESWIKIFTNNEFEAIMNKIQKKGLAEYQEIMEKSFCENYRILKSGRWMTVEFNNSKHSVWIAIQEALSKAGFVVADVRELDKKQGSFKQVTSSNTVKQDLVISAYKPSGGLDEYFGDISVGTEDSVWKFLDGHLKQLPVFVKKSDKIEIVVERLDHRLYSKIVSFHLQKGLSVPISTAEFNEKLIQKYPERDGMYFLSEQIPEYDQKRAQVKSIEQTTIFVEDEKSTILWLKNQLVNPTTLGEIQPKFLQEIHQNKFEKLPELSEILEQNFLEDDKGKWHIPDPTKLKDLEKLREKALLREFQTYQESKSKLKQFRLEAIRAGFKKKWSENNYKSIVDIAQRLPEKIIQEDSSLLMYYHNASSRL